MHHILEIDSVILEYEARRILHDVCVKIETGKITGLLGRNGSGKSSLMKMLFGELNPISQSVRLNRKTLLGRFRNPIDIRYVPQYNYIPKKLSLERVIKDFELDIDHIMDHFPHLKSLHKIRVKHLSGGDTRLLEVYILLVSKSKFCLLDEPFTHIMPLHIDAIKRLIIKEKDNKGIIVTDHMYQHILDISDNMYVIKDGKTYVAIGLADLGNLGYIRL